MTEPLVDKILFQKLVEATFTIEPEESAQVTILTKMRKIYRDMDVDM